MESTGLTVSIARESLSSRQVPTSCAQGVFICWVLSSRPSDNTSQFRLQRNHLYAVDSIRRGHASRDGHGLTEPKAVDLAAKSSSLQLGHRGNLCRLWMQVRRLDSPGYKDSQTSLQEYELPFGTRGASLPTLLLRAGRSHSRDRTLTVFGSNGTEGQRPIGLVCAHLQPQESDRGKMAARGCRPMGEEEYESAKLERLCQGVSPGRLDCNYPATVRCTTCGR